MSYKETRQRMISILFSGLIIYSAICTVVPSMMVWAEEQESSSELQYEYDELNRIVKAVYPDGTIVLYEYDPNGNITKTNIIAPDQEITARTTESTVTEQTITEQMAARTTESSVAEQTITEQTTARTTELTAIEPTIEEDALTDKQAAEHTSTDLPANAGISTERASMEYNRSNETTTENKENEESTTETLSVSNVEDNESRKADRDIQNWIPIVIGTAAAGLAAAGVMAYRRVHGEKGADEDEK